MLRKRIIKTFLLMSLPLAGVSFQAQAQFGTNANTQRQKYAVDYSTPIEYEIGGINVVGAAFNDANALINVSGLKVGDKITIPGEQVSKAIRKLWNLGIVGDVNISVTEIEGNKAYLQIELAERPKMSRYYFDGVSKANQTSLDEKLKLVKGRIVTDAMLKNAVNGIKKYYAEKGFKNVGVKVVKEKDPVLANAIVVRFQIDKGSKVKIEDLKFEGVEQMSETVLRRKMKKTKEQRFGRIFAPSKFIGSEYENDKKKVLEYYNEEGFRNAAIVRDTVYDVNPERVNIELEISEGKKFYYRDIEWTGNYKYTDQELGRVLGVQKGDVYNPAELQKRLSFNPNGQDISALYMDDGYLFFNIKPVEVLVEGDSIDIEMRVFEGEQSYINKVIVNGNTKTNDHVIMREIRTLPGQKFSRNDLIRTTREIATMGYFDPEQVNPEPKPNMADGTVDIVYNLVEKPNDQIELSGGWGGFYGFVGTVGLVFNNFSLRNIPNFKAWKPLPSGDGQRLSVRVQANGRQYQNYSFSFSEPWLGGKKPINLTVAYNYSVNRLFSSNTQVGSLGIQSISTSLGRRLKWPDDYFSLSNSLSFMAYDLNNYATEGFGNYTTGKSYNFNFNTTLTRNSVDNSTYPRRGSNLSLSLTLTPPYSLFDKKDFSKDLSPEDRFKWVEYNKWMFDNAWYQQIVGNLVLATRLHFGMLLPYKNAKGLGPFERFILGGDGLTQFNFLLGTEVIGLRGYENRSIVPPESNGEGGVAYAKYVAELRYLISPNPSATIYVQAFLEAGNTWGSMDEFNPFNVKRSAGVGARIFMPAFGMLGIDWGYGFDKIPGNPNAGGSQFHFIIGQQLR